MPRWLYQCWWILCWTRQMRLPRSSSWEKRRLGPVNLLLSSRRWSQRSWNRAFGLNSLDILLPPRPRYEPLKVPCEFWLAKLLTTPTTTVFTTHVIFWTRVDPYFDQAMIAPSPDQYHEHSWNTPWELAISIWRGSLLRSSAAPLSLIDTCAHVSSSVSLWRKSPSKISEVPPREDLRRALM